MFRVAAREFADYSPASSAMLANKLRVLVRTFPSAARVLAATARKRSSNTTQKILPRDKVPKMRRYQRRGGSCRLTRSNSSHRRRSTTGWKQHPAREAPKQFSSDPNFDLQLVRSFVRITLHRVWAAAMRFLRTAASARALGFLVRRQAFGTNALQH